MATFGVYRSSLLSVYRFLSSAGSASPCRLAPDLHVVRLLKVVVEVEESTNTTIVTFRVFHVACFEYQRQAVELVNRSLPRVHGPLSGGAREWGANHALAPGEWSLDNHGR